VPTQATEKNTAPTSAEVTPARAPARFPRLEFPSLKELVRQASGNAPVAFVSSAAEMASELCGYNCSPSDRLDAMSVANDQARSMQEFPTIYQTRSYDGKTSIIFAPGGDPSNRFASVAYARMERYPDIDWAPSDGLRLQRYIARHEGEHGRRRDASDDNGVLPTDKSALTLGLATIAPEIRADLRSALLELRDGIQAGSPRESAAFIQRIISSP